MPSSAGVARLSGAPVRALDVRAGAALVLAGLAAEGETVVFDPHHVDRGYPDLAATLRALGANVDDGSQEAPQAQERWPRRVPAAHVGGEQARRDRTGLGTPAILEASDRTYSTTSQEDCSMPIDTDLEPAELEQRIREAIELIRPALQSDGGDIEFCELDDDGVVHVSLVGACGTCPISMQTLKAGVERIIMDRAARRHRGRRRLHRRVTQPVAALVDATGNGDRAALARLLTIVESGGDAARDALAGFACSTATGSAAVVGITGAPGAGKSTLTDGLVARLRERGRAGGVLAIDPTSPFTGGAILGDRVRMQDHDTDDGVFIRSMATRGELGGLSRAAPHAVRVLDAAGYAWILVETVGVGQVEVAIAGTADTTIVVVTPGLG